MRPGDDTYPADEFDVTEARGGPRGVHRAPRSRAGRWLPFLVVLIVFPLLAFGIVTLLSDWPGLPGSDVPAVVEDDGAAEPATTEDGAVDEGAQTPTDAAATPEETTPAPPPAPEPDPATPVEVFNATSRSGLAGGAADRVEAAGFTAVTAGNWEGDDVEVSAVYYATPDDVATAQLVAQTLGITTVEESAGQAPEGVVVVLAADYTS